jgi:hypothetical protein
VLRHLQASDRLSVSAYVADPDTHKGHKYDLRLYCLLLGNRKVRHPDGTVKGHTL